ncbi:MAG: class I SAM-dependent RNA methyltransferase [Terriglobia bacterium]
MNVRIEKMVYGGEGLGHATGPRPSRGKPAAAGWPAAAGKPVFVPFVLPGEVVEVLPTQETRKLIRGLPEKILEAAADRIEPPCPYFTRCGGCHYQHLPYEQQLALKVEILRETLRRLGDIAWSEEIPALASPPWNYRNRIQLHLGPHPVRADRLQMGYYRQGTHTLCAIEQCPISSPRLNALILALNELNAAGHLPRRLRQVEAFVTDEDRPGWLSLGLPVLDFASDELATRLRRAWPGVESILFLETSTGQRVLAGAGSTRYRVNEEEVRVSHNSFFQVNRYLLPELAARTGDLSGTTAVDLYAGVGLFTRALARGFARVAAIEADPDTAADLAANSAALANVQAHCADAAAFLAQWREPVDCVMLDPPRAGLSKEAVRELLRLRPRRLLYLSCDPATLARDLKALAATFQIESLELIDLFPHTFHIETLARLRAD